MKFNILQQAQVMLREAQKGKSWRVMIVEEGLSKNGRYYPGKVLEKAVGLFDKAKAFFYEWKKGEYNHLPPETQRKNPGGFPRQIAGWYSDPKFEEVDIEGQKVRGITATLNIHDGAKWLQSMLKDAWIGGARKLLGLSIDADGSTGTREVDGRTLEVVSSIDKVYGVDLVTNPAAGGQLVRLLASYHPKNQGGNEMDCIKKRIEMIKKLRPEILEGVNIDTLNEETATALFEKALKAEEDPAEKEKKELADKAKSLGLPETATKEEVEKAEKEKAAAAAAGGGDAEKEKKDLEARATKVGLKSDASKEDIEKAEAAAGGDGKDTDVKEDLKSVMELVKQKKFDQALAMLKQMVGEGGDTAGQEAVKKLMKTVEGMQNKIAVTEAEVILKSTLSKSKLPEEVRKKIADRYKGRVFEAKDLETEVKIEKDVLAKLSESGEVDLEDVDLETGRTGHQRLQASFDLMIDSDIEDGEKDVYADIKALGSLREAYVRITGDVNVSGEISRKKLQEATTSDFSYILGTSINRRMAKDYKLQPAQWKELCEITNLKDFKKQEAIRWGGFANLETVSESTTTDFPAIAIPPDEEATYSPATRGGLVTITRRMIINDDLRALVKLPKKLARSAARTLNVFVFDLLLNFSSTINGGTIYDSLALYHANHFNAGTAALDYDSYGDARDRLIEQKETGYTADLADDPLNASDTDFDLDSTTIAANVNVGDYIKIDAEFLGPVTVVSSANITVTSRGIWGSSAASHSANADVSVVTDDLALEPGILWVPTDLRTMGEAILKNEYEDDTLSNRNPYKGSAKLMVLPRRTLRGDVNNWYLTANKADIEMIEVGFVQGKKEPMLLRQDAPGVGLVFTRDVIRYKVRHEYGGTVVDYRGFQSGIVS